MHRRFKQFLDLLARDYRRVHLSWLLIAINVVLVVGVVIGVSWSAVQQMSALADRQGLVRVQLAGATAHEELRKINEDLLAGARDLTRRSTLRRLVDEASPAVLAPYLRRACQQLNAEVCAVVRDDAVIAQSREQLDGAALPWRDIAIANTEQGDRFMGSFDGLPKPVMGASALLSAKYSTAETRVYVLVGMDDKLAARLSERAALPVRILNYRTFTSSPADAFTQLHSSAVSDGRSAAARIEQLDVFASSYPVYSVTGEAVALIETRLPSAEIDAALGALVKRLLITALILAALAVLAAVGLAKQVAEPMRQLTDAAARLGHGDFSTSIPEKGAAEVGVLARTMEDMRRNLLQLTGALRQREAEAQAVLNGVVEGVFAVDKSRAITYLNAQAATLLGIHPQDAIGKFCGDVLKPCANGGELPCENRCPILRAREGGNVSMVEPLIGADGRARSTIIMSAAPVDGLQVQIVRDETDLEAARRARDSVLANISHEFRTPLAAQLASLELLRDGLTTMSEAQQRELVSSMERGTHRLTRLIDNLLESVRIESGQLAVRHQALAVAELVDDARALLGSLFELRRQALIVELPDELPTLTGDGPRLTQVLVNLLANANKYAPENSAIRIGARAGDDKLVIWVDDEGPGVPEAARNSIFDRFARGAIGEEPEPGGLGLGLWIAKSIVERHGGHIDVDRVADTRTRFAVTLPLAPESAAAAKPV